MKDKRYIGLFLVVFLLMVAVAPAFAATTPNIMLIEAKGNETVPDEKILGEVSNSIIGRPLDTQALQKDMQKIMETGYFANIRVETESFFDGVKVIFVVVENPVFKEVQFTGLTKLDPQELVDQFRQQSGEVFNTTFFSEDLQKALKYAQTKYGLFINPKGSTSYAISEDGVVALELVELKVGKITINGLEKTDEKVVRRELSLKEGDLFNYNSLSRDYMRLSQLMLFENIEPSIEQSSIEDSLDLVLNITEGSTGSFSAGISYSDATGKVGGLLEYSESNLMGLGQSLTLNTTFDEDSKEVLFSFQEPWLDDKHTAFGLSMWNSDAEIASTLSSWGSSYDLDNPYSLDLVRTGLSLSFGRPWKDWSSRIKFNFERNEIFDYWEYHDSDETSMWDESKLDLGPTEFWNNSVELQLVKNNITYKDQFFAESGYQLLGNYQVAGDYLGGEFDYQKLTLEGKYFHPITSNLVFGTRLQGVNLEGEYPDYEALYLGGMNRLRGYHDRRFHDEDTPELIGTSYLLSNTELRYQLPMNKNVELVLFYDIGQVHNLAGEDVIKSDYGLGFRIKIPFLGLIRLDYARTENDSRTMFGIQETF